MKILFLDIDGVLNSSRSCLAFGMYPMNLQQLHAFDHVAIGLIQTLCEADPNVKIVLSSAWRLTYKHDAVGKALGLPIIDRTVMLNTSRGAEIAEWLGRHPDIETWVIVDDDDDMLDSQQSRFVKTDHSEGLSWANFRDICDTLGVNPMMAKQRERNWQSQAPSTD